MNIQETRFGNIVVIAIRGVIKLSESGKQLSGHLQKVLETGDGSVLVDLSEVEEVDSTGLGELVAYLQLFAKQDRGFAVVRPTAKIKRLFEFMNLHKVLPIFDDMEQAVAAVGSVRSG